MRMTTTMITIALCVPLSLLHPLPALAQTSNILIEEIAWAGSSLSIADEWIELVNLGETAATIGGYTLHDMMEPDRILTIPDGAEIPPFGTYLIANYAETNEKSALATTVQLVTTGVSLSNSTLGLELRDASGLAIDRAGDGSAPFAGSTGSFASMIRGSATSSGDRSDSWTTATTSSNWKAGILDQGTPGVCDLCSSDHRDEVPSPVESTETVSSEVTTSIEMETTDVETSSPTTTEAIMSGATTTVEIITSNEASVTSSTTEIVTETQTETMSAETPDITRRFVTISEVVSNPTSGKEWIELRFESSTTGTDRELFLYDGKGRIATIAANTPLTIAPYLIVSLSSAKLNNDGETLSLRETDGEIIETTMIPELEKGTSWARNPQTDAWNTTETMTPAAENVIYTTPSQTNSTSATKTTTSSVAETSGSTASATTSTEAIVSNATSTTPSAPRISVRLSEAVSNPLSGPEWVELVFADGTTSTDRELLLKDAQGTIARIPAHTALTASPYLIAPLSSARLNNGGDALTLTETNGVVLDATEIPSLAKGESWAFHSTTREWHIASMLTPGAQNQFDEDAIADTDEQTSPANDPSSDLISEIMSVAEQSNAENSSSGDVKTSSKKSDAITPYPFSDMFNSSLNGSRVRVSGTVGSVHRLFGASHVFVLLAEDGRGLMVYLPKHLNVPAFGSTVQVNGTLSTTYQGPELRMKTTDVWMTMATGTPPVPRTVDLLAPGSEDAWSLTNVEGIVKAVSASSLSIETEDGVDVTVSIPSAANIRAKRFQKDDKISVSALLNIRKETPTIVVRSADDVTLISHAEGTVTPPSEGKKTGLPDWIPFIAAGGAIAATGTSKRLREYVKRKRLAKKARV